MSALIETAASEDAMLRESLKAFRKKQIEPRWEHLNVIDAEAFEPLWRGLQELGVTTLGLPEAAGGVLLDPADRAEIFLELGAALPALGAALLSHVTAVSLISEACSGVLPQALAAAVTTERFALLGSPLDAEPDTTFSSVANGRVAVSGERRAMLAHAGWLVLPARSADGLKLCVIRQGENGVTFSETPSSHGLALLPFGTLTLDHVPVAPEHVWPWPTSGHVANEADGLLTSLLVGLIGELSDRSMAYALERYQGGKMIHEHDAVRQLVGPIELARRPLAAVALATLRQPRRGDASASTFAIEHARQSGLDAIQTFGGYGYMEDYRVERYLRDANTLETFWIHAAARKRAIACARFVELKS